MAKRAVGRPRILARIREAGADSRDRRRASGAAGKDGRNGNRIHVLEVNDEKGKRETEES